VINEIIKYFDLQSNNRKTVAKGTGASDHAPVWPQYLVVALGVIIEPFLRTYSETGAWRVDLSSVWGRTVFGLIVAAVILPGIYKTSFETTRPKWIQLMALFPMGLGWQTLFAGAVQTVSR